MKCRACGKEMTEAEGVRLIVLSGKKRPTPLSVFVHSECVEPLIQLKIKKYPKLDLSSAENSIVPTYHVSGVFYDQIFDEKFSS